jgi:hypothetical protein
MVRQPPVAAGLLISQKMLIDSLDGKGQALDEIPA